MLITAMPPYRNASNRNSDHPRAALAAAAM
jgi:hypothetical protein